MRSSRALNLRPTARVLRARRCCPGGTRHAHVRKKTCRRLIIAVMAVAAVASTASAIIISNDIGIPSAVGPREAGRHSASGRTRRPCAAPQSKSPAGREYIAKSHVCTLGQGTCNGKKKVLTVVRERRSGVEIARQGYGGEGGRGMSPAASPCEFSERLPLRRGAQDSRRKQQVNNLQQGREALCYVCTSVRRRYVYIIKKLCN